MIAQKLINTLQSLFLDLDRSVYLLLSHDFFALDSAKKVLDFFTSRDFAASLDETDVLCLLVELLDLKTHGKVELSRFLNA